MKYIKATGTTTCYGFICGLHWPHFVQVVTTTFFTSLSRRQRRACVMFTDDVDYICSHSSTQLDDRVNATQGLSAYTVYHGELSIAVFTGESRVRRPSGHLLGRKQQSLTPQRPVKNSFLIHTSCLFC